jgi:hypothetical protein
VTATGGVGGAAGTATGGARAAGPRLRGAMLLVCAVAVVAATLGIGVRATFGAHVAVDETQYMLTAISLVEDGDLDIADERAQRRWRDFADEEPPVQAEPLADGRRISPHDPLLPAVLALPVGLAGWVGGKLALTLVAGALAALTLWVAVRRFGVPAKLATGGVALAAASTPLAVHGQQLYPELPAALVTLVGVAAVTAPLDRRPDRPGPGAGALALLAVAVTALPWLSVKYLPVAAALALVGGARAWRAGRRRALAVVAAALAAMAVAYLAGHRVVWGGWTVYASGDHFQQSGEFGVLGFHPSYLGRAERLVSLLVDRGYGIVAWQPAWLLLLPALGALAARRPRHWPALVAPLVGGWLMATFLAVTMSGYWWPGRQLVVVLPLALVLVLWWLGQLPRWVWAPAAALGLAGVVSYGWLLAAGWAREITWVSGFQTVGAPPYRLVRPLLPDYLGEGYWGPHLVWAAVLLGCAAAGWWSVRTRGRSSSSPPDPGAAARVGAAAGPRPGPGPASSQPEEVTP